MKIKNYFLKIMASLVVSASFLGVAVIPGQAAVTNNKITRSIFGKDYVSNNDDKATKDAFDNAFEKVLNECQTAIQNLIDEEIKKDLGKGVESIELLGTNGKKYELTKARYQHIAYGEYLNSFHSKGLHMRSGLSVLEESKRIFKDKIKKFIYCEKIIQEKGQSDKKVLCHTDRFKGFLSSTSPDIKDKAEKLEEYYKKIDKEETYIRMDTDANGLMHCKLKFSDVSYLERYLFPEDWTFEDLKTALQSAIDQKEAMKITLKRKYDEISECKDELVNALKKSNVNDTLYAPLINGLSENMKGRLKKLESECEGDVLPNLYGYANKNGRSITFHAIENPKKKNQKILVQLITSPFEDREGEEIVTFFPISAERFDLSNNDVCVVKNMDANPADYSDAYDIFWEDELDGTKFIKRALFAVPRDSEKLAKEAPYLNNLLNKIENLKRSVKGSADIKKLSGLLANVGSQNSSTSHDNASSNQTNALKSSGIDNTALTKNIDAQDKSTGSKSILAFRELKKSVSINKTLEDWLSRLISKFKNLDENKVVAETIRIWFFDHSKNKDVDNSSKGKEAKTSKLGLSKEEIEKLKNEKEAESKRKENEFRDEILIGGYRRIQSSVNDKNSEVYCKKYRDTDGKDVVKYYEKYTEGGSIKYRKYEVKDTDGKLQGEYIGILQTSRERRQEAIKNHINAINTLIGSEKYSVSYSGGVDLLEDIKNMSRKDYWDDLVSGLLNGINEQALLVGSKLNQQPTLSEDEINKIQIELTDLQNKNKIKMEEKKKLDGEMKELKDVIMKLETEKNNAEIAAKQNELIEKNNAEIAAKQNELIEKNEKFKKLSTEIKELGKKIEEKKSQIGGEKEKTPIDDDIDFSDGFFNM